MSTPALAELRLFDTDVSAIDGTIPKVIKIAEEGKVILGRGAKAHILLSAQKDGKFIISRQHAMLEASIVATAGAKKVMLTVQDLNSLNGVYVNSLRVANATLTEGDIVQFGGMSDVPIGGVLTNSDVSLRYSVHFPSHTTHTAHTTPKTASPQRTAAKPSAPPLSETVAVRTPSAVTTAHNNNTKSNSKEISAKKEPGPATKEKEDKNNKSSLSVSFQAASPLSVAVPAGPAPTPASATAASVVNTPAAALGASASASVAASAVSSTGGKRGRDVVSSSSLPSAAALLPSSPSKAVTLSVSSPRSDGNEDASALLQRSPLNVVKRAKLHSAAQSTAVLTTNIDSVTPEEKEKERERDREERERWQRDLRTMNESHQKDMAEMRKKMELLHELVMTALLQKERERESEKEREKEKERKKEKERELERQKQEREAQRAEEEKRQKAKEKEIEKEREAERAQFASRERELIAERERLRAELQQLSSEKAQQEAQRDAHRDTSRDALQRDVSSLALTSQPSCVVDAAALKEQLCCVLCHSLYVNAVVLRCSHAFCRHCVEQHWQEKSGSKNCTLCPICCDPFPPSLSAKEKERLYYPCTPLDELVFLMVEAGTLEEREAFELRENEARAVLKRLRIDVDKGYAFADSGSNMEMREKEREKESNRGRGSNGNGYNNKQAAREKERAAEEVCEFCGESGHSERRCPSKHENDEDSGEDEDFS